MKPWLSALLCVSAVEALKCFQCNSLDDPNCESDGGDVVECPDAGACVISSDTEKGKDSIFTRSCAPLKPSITCKTVETSGRTLTFCNCDTDLCNWSWNSAGSTESPTESLSCYSCHNASDAGPCSETEPGKVMFCPLDGACVIKIQSSLGMESVFSRGCVPNLEEDEVGCDIVDTEEAKVKFCNCKTELCNESWESAGVESTSTVASSLECYQCSSNMEEECTAESHPLKKVGCPDSGACVISMMENNNQIVTFERDCVPEVPDRDIKCDTEVVGDSSFSFCNCRNSLCNADWISAGSTSSQGQSTSSSTTVSYTTGQTQTTTCNC